MALLLPLVFLVILELVLRLANLFPRPPLFLENKEDNLVTINSDIGERYFNKKSVPVPNLYPQTFTLKKNQSTFRIFCLGGSTTAGFPYEMTVPFPQQLKFMLEDNYPDFQFEVINLGLSAVNSFTVWDWMPEVIRYDPDLVLIYMGHNEFYGALGAASSISIGKNGGFSRFMLKLQKIRLVNGMTSLARAFQPDRISSMDITLMEKIVREKNIALNSKIRARTYRNFEINLELILEKLAKNHIPVVMGNLVCNLKDQPPLDQKTALFEAATAAGSPESLSIFIEARDKDEVPFRAPSRINEIITDVSRQKGVPLTDIFSAFARNSQYGIPGDTLFCDHLHPNPRGYHLMAGEFFQALQPFLPENVNINLSKKPKYVTQLDWEIGGLRVFKLEKKWPFYNQEKKYQGSFGPGHEKLIEIAEDFLVNHHIWGKAHSDLAAYYESINEHDAACREYEAIVAMYPEKLDYHLKLIDAAKRAKGWSVMEKTATRALALTSVKGMLFYNIALAQRNMGRFEDAYHNLEKSLGTRQLSHDQLAYVFYLKALVLTDIREYEEAVKILNVILEEAPDFEAARLLKEEIIQRR